MTMLKRLQATTNATGNVAASTSDPTWSRRAVQTTSSAAAARHTIALPATRTIGDALVVFVATSTRVDLATPAGWTLVATVDRRLFAWYRECRGDEPATLTTSVSAVCTLLATATAHAGLATRSPIYYAFTDSPVLRTLVPMATLDSAPANGVLLHAALTEAVGSWTGWTEGVTELADQSVTTPALTLAVAERHSAEAGEAPLTEATFGTVARHYTLSLALAATGIRTVELGNPYTSAGDTGRRSITADQYNASIFTNTAGNAWIYRLAYTGGAESPTAEATTRAGVYAVAANAPTDLLARAAPQLFAKRVGAASPPAGVAFLVGDTAKTTASPSLNLRASASTSATIVTTMPTNSTVTILEGPQSNGGYRWWKVRFGSQVGWAAQDFLQRVINETIARTGVTAQIVDNGQGATIAGVPVAQNQQYALAIATTASNLDVPVHTSATGIKSVFRGAAADGALPSTTAGALAPVTNIGHLAISALADSNVAPEAPLLLEPTLATAMTTRRPTFKLQFRDRNGRYGTQSGLGIDRGDYITAFELAIRYAADVLPNIANGHFDQGIDTWGNLQKSAGLTVEATHDTTVKRTGAGALKLAITANTANTAPTFLSFDYTLDFNVDPHIEYTLKWAGRTAVATMIPNMRALWFDEYGNQIGISGPLVWGTVTINTWSERTLSLVAPAGAEKLRIQCYVEVTNATVVNSVQYDDISIERVNLYTTTVSTSTDEQRAAEELIFTLPNDLDNNRRYEWTARTADAFGTWGPWATPQTFLLALTGPTTALYPNEAILFNAAVPGYYQPTTRPDFIFRWQSNLGTSMYKFDFELGAFPDFRTTDPYRQVCTGATRSSQLTTTTLQVGLTDTVATTLYTTNPLPYDPALHGPTSNRRLVLLVGTEFMLVEQVDLDGSPPEITVRRGYFGSRVSTHLAGRTARVLQYTLWEPWTPNRPVTHTLAFNELFLDGPDLTQKQSFAPLQPSIKYYWRMRGYDTGDTPSLWSEGMINEVNPETTNRPAVYAVDRDELTLLRTTSNRVKLYFCVWDTWKFQVTYPKLTWIKGSDPRNPVDYTADKVASGAAPYEIRFPANQATESAEVNANVQQSAFVLLGEYTREDFGCVVNVGPNRLAFVGEAIPFSAAQSWQAGYNPGQGWTSSQFSWTFENAVPATATGVGPHQVQWAVPGLYTVTCRYGNEDPVERKVRVYADREQIDYDVVEVGNISGGPQSGWTGSVTIKQQLGNLVEGNLTGIQEFQSVGLFCEEEWLVDGQWVRQPVSGYVPEPRCLVTGYVQNGSIKIDANTHTFSFNINPVSEQLKLVTMYGTQTWSYDYYRNVALMLTPELIPQGSMITTNPMFIIDVMVLLLKKWTNVLTRHDFIAWYDTSLQTKDTISTNEGPLWSGLSSLAEAEYAWLYTDQGNGIRFEPNPSLRSWGAFNDLHPIPYVLDDRDIWNIDVQQKLMNTINYAQVTGYRPYYPNSIFEGRYPGQAPTGTIGQWLVKTGQSFSSQWFADYMAENMYWDANRKITATVAMGLNRRIDIPGRVFINLEIPERGLYFDAKEFYVIGGGYQIAPAEGKLTTSLQLIENMYRSSGITGVRRNVQADARIAGVEALLPADALLMLSDGNLIAQTTLAQSVTDSQTTVTLASVVDVYVGALLKIDSELMRVTSIDGSSVTVVRGFAGTTPASHLANALTGSVVYFENLGIDLVASAVIGGTQTDLLADTYLILRGEAEMVADTLLLAGPTEVDASAVVLANTEINLDAFAILEQSRELTVTASYLLLIVKSKSMFADAVITGGS